MKLEEEMIEKGKRKSEGKTKKTGNKWLEILDRNKTSDHGFEVPTDISTIVYPTTKPTIPAF